MINKTLCALSLCGSMALLAQEHNLVAVKTIYSTIVLDLRYATTNNFLKTQIYDVPRCYLHTDAAQALKQVVDELAKDGLGIKIFDAYRPLHAQWRLWEVCPDQRFVADPRKGGRHTRGTAVDLTLIRLFDQSELAMPTEFDSFEKEARADYQDLSQEILANRTKLQDVMIKHGFTTVPYEWWHFDLKDYETYPTLDIPLNELP